MSVTIDSLDIQIRSSAGSAKQNIEELAKALEKLNGQAKVTKIVNALERLNGALTNLRSNSGVMGQLTALSKSLERLASLPKLTGLQSAITQLKRLPQVINDLDTADIAQFTLRLRQLSNALTPLATQMATIGTAFNRLPTSIRRVVSGVNQLNTATHAHSQALDTQSLNLMATLQNLQDYLSMIHFVGDAIGAVMADAIEWDGIQFRFGRAFGEDAEEVYAYAQKVSDVLKINIQQFMQYSSLYGSLLSGFGMTQEKITTISVGLTELSYDIWAAYNDRFKTLEDASEAVRSAITGEIEPIRNAGIALTEASLQEYIDSTHLAGVSIEKLSEAQKSEVRYAAMVNAAMNQGIVGTYAREMQTAEGAVRTLSQQMKTLGQSIGSLFLPILQVVVPYLNAFVELIYEGVVALAAMLGIPFQKITWDTASAAGGVGSLAENADDATGALGSAAKAAKKLKSYTMGFDELNIIDPSSGASGGGSGGAGGGAGDGGWGEGLDLKTLWDDSVFASASQQVDELKQKVKDFYKDWMWQIEALGAGIALMGLGKMVEMLKEAEVFSGGFLKNMNTISKIGLAAIVITLQWTLMSEFLENYIETGEWQEYIKAAVTAGLGTWALGAMWGPAGVVIGLSITAAVSLKAAFADGSIDSVEEVVTLLTGLAAAVAAVAVSWKKVIPAIAATNFGTLFGWLLKGDDLGTILALAFPKLATVVSTATTWVTGTLVPGIMAALGRLAAALGMSMGATALTIAGVVVAAIVGAILIVKHWDDIKVFFTETVPTWFSGAVEKVKEVWGVVSQWFNDTVITPLVNFFAPIVEWISQFFYGCWLIIQAVWVVASGWFNTTVIQPIVGFFSWLWESVSGFFSDLWEDVKEVWDVASDWMNETVVEPIAGWFEGLWEDVSGFFSELWKDVKEVWDPVASWFDKTVIQPLAGFFETAWENIQLGFETAFSAVRDFAVSIINGLIGYVETGINNIIASINALLEGFNNAAAWAAGVLGKNWGGVTLLKEVSLPRIQYKADGGFLEDGLFTMNHGEIAGKFNNGKSVVANNHQIVEGIAAGVYRAVVQAMSDTSRSSDQNVNVYLDGKQIYASIKRTEAERGVSLMGNQLGYTY